MLKGIGKYDAFRRMMQIVWECERKRLRLVGKSRLYSAALDERAVAANMMAEYCNERVSQKWEKFPIILAHDVLIFCETTKNWKISFEEFLKEIEKLP